MKLTIHQIEFLSYLGFWQKLDEADHIVLLDEVDFRKNYFQNRNKILIDGVPKWFGIEVEKSSKTPIKHVRTSSVFNPIKKVKQLEHAYKKAKYYDDYGQSIIEIFKYATSSWLIDYSYPLFQLVKDNLGIDTKVSFQSSKIYEGDKADLILDICIKNEAETYLSGKSGIDYLDFTKFEENNIEVKVQDYQHPEYNQLGDHKFVPYCSIIDLLFNEGPNSLKIIRNGKRQD